MDPIESRVVIHFTSFVGTLEIGPLNQWSEESMVTISPVHRIEQCRSPRDISSPQAVLITTLLGYLNQEDFH